MSYYKQCADGTWLWQPGPGPAYLAASQHGGLGHYHQHPDGTWSTYLGPGPACLTPPPLRRPQPDYPPAQHISPPPAFCVRDRAAGSARGQDGGELVFVLLLGLLVAAVAVVGAAVFLLLRWSYRKAGIAGVLVVLETTALVALLAAR